MFRRYRLCRALAAFFCTGFTPVASAQITLDGTVGPGVARQLTPGSNGNFAIRADDGTQLGGNLFHSFGVFNVQTGQSATFNALGSSSPISNVIGRVTGGSFSNIDGALRSTIQGANLFLVNPAGILFGPNASLDVSGSFHASTAHYVALGTSGRYDTIGASPTVLSSAPPSAFGFMGPANAIVVDRSVLTGAAGRGLTFVGGPIQVSGATLSAPGGGLNLASVASAGEVSLSPPDATTRLGPAGGSIELVNGTVIDASATANLAGGRIVIRGGALTLQDATVVVQNEGPQAGLGIVIDASEALSMERSAVGTITFDAGSAGPISITSPSISIAGGQTNPSDVFGIVSQSQGRGAAGAIEMQTTQLTMTAGATIQTIATAGGQGGAVSIAALDSVSVSGAGMNGFPTNISSFSIGAGNGGDVRVVAPVVALDGGAILTNVAGTGAAGSIDLAANRVSLTNGGLIDSSSFAMGAAGAISVTAAESITLTGGGGLSSRVGSVAFARGAGGDILLDAPRIDLTRAQVSSRSTDAGAAGNITVRTSDLVASFSTIDASAEGSGAAGNIDIQAARVAVKDNSQINSSALSSASGRVSVTASESISIARGAGSATVGDTGLFSITSGGGSGGAVVATAPMIALDEGSIRTRSVGSGDAGDIAVQTSQLTLASGSQIDSSAFGSGAAGNLTIDALESVAISGSGSGGRFSGLFSAASADGAGGDIVVRSPAVSVTGAFLSADARGAGSPGTITVEAGTLALIDGGTISANTHAPGPGARVSITATESFTIAGRDAANNPSSVLGTNRGAGGGTDIVINTPVMTIDRGLISTASFDSGPGGGITIDSNRVALFRGGQIVSSSNDAGAAGNVSVTAADSITMTGADAGNLSGIYARVFASGDGSAVTLNAPVITLDGAVVNVDTVGRGAAGTIAVTAARLELSNGAVLDSSTSASGHGGTINVVASESVTIAGRSDVLISGITSTASARGSAGAVTIESPAVIIDGGVVAGDTGGAGAGGNITIDTARLDVRNRGQIVSTAAGSGDGGRLSITASESVTITSPAATPDGSGLFGFASNSGRGGDIEVSAPIVSVAGGSIAASTLGAGHAGNVTIRGSQVNVSAGGLIDSSSIIAGNAGRVLIDATDAIAVSGRRGGSPSRISSATLGSGSGGEVVLRAPTVDLDVGEVRVDSFGSGDGGKISIDAARLTLAREAKVSSSTFGDGEGGSVRVNATEALSIRDVGPGRLQTGLFAIATGQGHGGGILVSAPHVTVDGGSISSATFGAGAAGRIAIDAQAVSAAGGGVIDSSSRGGSGAAGVVSLTASNSIRVAGRGGDELPSTIASGTTGPGRGGDLILTAPTVTVDDAIVRVDTSGRGAAGRLAVDAERVTISGGGALASGTGGIGDGGTLNVTASESILVTGRNPEGRSRIINSSAGAGNAGEISISAPRINLEDGGFVNGNASESGSAGSIAIRGGTLTLDRGEISTSTAASGRGGSIDIAVTGAVDMTGSIIRATSQGSGDAGNIFIDAGRSLTLAGSSITTEATRADGGNIEIIAIDLLRLTDSEITTSVGTGFGNGGNITIDPVFVILDSSRIIANAFGGDGGNINIVTSALLQTGDSIISASSELGIQGTIEISAPDSDLAGGLTPLPGGLFDSSLLLRESCSARAGRGGNSFVGVGYGGLPERPGTLAFSSYAQRPAATAGHSASLFALAASFDNACAR